MAIAENGSDEQKQRFLPPTAGGNMLLTFAVIEPDARYDESGIQTKATAGNGDYELNGVKLFASNAHVANFILVAARTSGKGVTMFIVDAKSPGVTINPLTTVSGDKLNEVKLEGVKVPANNILGKLDQGWPIAEKLMQRDIVAKCAELMGGATRVIDMSVNYAKERHQFGRPVGSFQAVQHHCVNMSIESDGLRMITYQAAWMLSEGIPCANEISMAKAWASTVYPKIALLGHQVHGAIAYTKDYDMYLYFMQAMAGDVYMGDADHHYTLIGRELLK
jgi:alkylation response protein AidB-like acyl-CoA dehydrogenase